MQAFSDFRYHRTFIGGERDVVLEFSAKVGDRDLKGIDMIRFDEAGRIVDFEVMVRPASGLQALGAEMARRMGPILAAKRGEPSEHHSLVSKTGRWTVSPASAFDAFLPDGSHCTGSFDPEQTLYLCATPVLHS